jgi:hypothetical protein
MPLYLLSGGTMTKDEQIEILLKQIDRLTNRLMRETRNRFMREMWMLAGGCVIGAVITIAVYLID